MLSIGAGGLGSAVLQYLAAAGVGTLGVIDDDTVEQSNLQRQVLHGESDVGQLKVDSAAESIGRLNSTVEVRRHPVRLTRANAVGIVSGYDLVVDGSDNFATRYLVNDACAIAGIPYVWGSILGFEGQVSVFWQDAPEGGVTYRDLHPQAPPPGAVPSCAEAGVLGALCGVVGSLMATESLKLLTGIGDVLLGRVLVIDLMGMRWREVPFRSRGESRITELLPGPAEVGDDGLPSISVDDLARLIDDGGRVRLVDVREPWEVDIVRIEGAEEIPLDTFVTDPAAYAGESDDGRDVVLYCKSGGRSAQALRAALDAGVTGVRHLDGGILAWVEQIHPELQLY